MTLSDLEIGMRGAWFSGGSLYVRSDHFTNSNQIRHRNPDGGGRICKALGTPRH